MIESEVVLDHIPLTSNDELRSVLFSDLHNCHSIPNPIIRNILSKHFETAYLVYGDSKELENFLLNACKNEYAFLCDNK